MVAMQIVARALENRVLFDLHHYVKVARCSAAAPGLPFVR